MSTGPAVVHRAVGAVTGKLFGTKAGGSARLPTQARLDRAAADIRRAQRRATDAVERLAHVMRESPPPVENLSSTTNSRTESCKHSS